ncbi:reverse transcriptase domain-containing protein [Tanacetum coccineum]
MTLCSKKGVVKHPKDFLIDVTLEDNEKKADKKVDTKPTNTKLSCEWKLFTDGATSSDRSAGRSPIEAVNRRERDLTARVLLVVNAAKILQDYEKCKEQSAIRKVSESSAMTAESGWPFSHWGVNILGPLPIAPRGFKFLAIAAEHSTKWVEAKPLTVINGRHAERSVWEYVVCRF